MASAAVARSFRRSFSSTLSSSYHFISKRFFSSSSAPKPPPLPCFSRPVSLSQSSAAFRLNSIRCWVNLSGGAYSPLSSGSNFSHLPASFPGRNSHVRFYSVKEMTKKISFKDGNIMSSPRKTKFFKSRKGRVKGISYNDICFGKYALQALEPGRIKPRQIQAARREMSRIAGGRIWARKRAEFRNCWGRGSPAYYVPVVKPGRILYEMGDGSENNQHIARTAGLIATWIQKDRAKENPST